MERKPMTGRERRDLDRLNKLPHWAQKRIAELESDCAHLRAELARETEKTIDLVAGKNAVPGNPRLWMPFGHENVPMRSSGVLYELIGGAAISVNPRNTDRDAPKSICDVLEITSPSERGRILVEPRASNVVWIRVEER